MGRPGEGGGELIEWKHVVDERSRARLVEQIQQQFPCVTAYINSKPHEAFRIRQ